MGGVGSAGMGASEAWGRIAAERRRQISQEGWSPAHDDQHDDGSLLHAAVTYLHHGSDVAAPIGEDGVPLGWPWGKDWWKPKDRFENVVRAGALCLAERERCLRAGVFTGPADHKLGLCLDVLSGLSLPTKAN